MDDSHGTSLSTKINSADSLALPVFNHNALSLFSLVTAVPAWRFTSLGARPAHPRVHSLLSFSLSQVELRTLKSQSQVVGGSSS
jgi:hypothetical protein